MKKLFAILALSTFVALPLLDAEAASKPKYKRENFSKAEQQKLYDRALKLCRKEFGSKVQRVRVNYRTGRFQCYYYF